LDDDVPIDIKEISHVEEEKVQNKVKSKKLG
jgi:hypothetical protein